MKNNILFIVSMVALSGLLAFSAYNVITITNDYRKAKEKIDNIKEEYHPDIPMETIKKAEETVPEEKTDDKESESFPVANLSIEKMKEKYPDIIGWITFPDTMLDCPVMKAENNGKYLRHDIDRRWSIAGTPFMDYRNNGDFSEFSTVIYGHHMEDGSMFAGLKKYRDQNYFDSHNIGYLLTPDKTYILTPVIISNVDASDKSVYRFDEFLKDDVEAYWKAALKKTYAVGDINTSDAESRYVILSTCAYEWKTARMILVCKITEYRTGS